MSKEKNSVYEAYTNSHNQFIIRTYVFKDDMRKRGGATVHNPAAFGNAWAITTENVITFVFFFLITV